MAFRVPQMPLFANLWRKTKTVAMAPTLLTACSLTPIHRTFSAPFDAGIQTTYPAYLLVPALSDIRPAGLYVNSTLEDCVEVPAGSGRYYSVDAVEDIAKGFANEYRRAVITPLSVTRIALAFWVNPNPWAVPIWPAPIP